MEYRVVFGAHRSPWLWHTEWFADLARAQEFVDTFDGAVDVRWIEDSDGNIV
jgi:hypothetical protein